MEEEAFDKNMENLLGRHKRVEMSPELRERLQQIIEETPRAQQRPRVTFRLWWAAAAVFLITLVAVYLWPRNASRPELPQLPTLAQDRENVEAQQKKALDLPVCVPCIEKSGADLIKFTGWYYKTCSSCRRPHPGWDSRPPQVSGIYCPDCARKLHVCALCGTKLHKPVDVDATLDGKPVVASGKEIKFYPIIFRDAAPDSFPTNGVIKNPEEFLNFMGPTHESVMKVLNANTDFTKTVLIYHRHLKGNSPASIAKIIETSDKILVHLQNDASIKTHGIVHLTSIPKSDKPVEFIEVKEEDQKQDKAPSSAKATEGEVTEEKAKEIALKQFKTGMETTIYSIKLNGDVWEVYVKMTEGDQGTVRLVRIHRSTGAILEKR